MLFTFYFDQLYMRDPIPEETKLEMCKERATKELASRLMREATAEVTPTGAVRVSIEVR